MENRSEHPQGEYDTWGPLTRYCWQLKTIKSNAQDLYDFQDSSRRELLTRELDGIREQLLAMYNRESDLYESRRKSL